MSCSLTVNLNQCILNDECPEGMFENFMSLESHEVHDFQSDEDYFLT